MKRLIATFSLLLTVIAVASAQNDAMYVYRNDGVINAFLKTDIDSLSYSHFNSDSVYYNEWQVQVVHTRNSIYMIPLADIDSVSFAPVSQDIYSIAKNDLTDSWNEGYVLMNGSMRPSAYMFLQQDEVSGVITMFVSDAANIDSGSAVCALFDSTGKLQFVTGEGKTGIVLTEDGIEYMSIYDSDGQLLKKVNISDNPAETKSRDVYRKGDAASSIVGMIVDGAGDVQNFIDLANVENCSDAANLVANIGGGLAGTAVVVLGGLAGWPAVIAGAAVGGLKDAIYALIKKLLYGSCNTKITEVIAPSEAGGSFKVGINITNNSALDESEKKYFAVVGRAGNDRVDFTHKDYSTASYEVSRASQSHYEIPFQQDLRVGHIHLVPYLQTEGGLSGKYNTIREWTIKYGEKFDYVYPDPQIISCRQTGGMEQNDDIMVRLEVQGSICSTRNVSQVGYQLLGADDLVAEGTEYVSGREFEFDITKKISKKYFPKDNKGKFKLYVYAVGTTNAEHAYSKEEIIELGVHTCPDDHHPHAIDLGLPSGTKWACCNVGASSPEQYGGYYAWGETSEKSVYYWDTYAYYNDNTGFINIGSDIAGTQYDVAHVRMGGSWRMPSHKQQMELMSYCTRQWTQQNGVNGILVTGPSGGQIFLPAAGVRFGDCLYSDGPYGYYWSSSLNPGSDGHAYDLAFNSGCWDWYDDLRYDGQSVRAVCP